jgi:hypothetical protein
MILFTFLERHSFVPSNFAKKNKFFGVGLQTINQNALSTEWPQTKKRVGSWFPECSGFGWKIKIVFFSRGSKYMDYSVLFRALADSSEVKTVEEDATTKNLFAKNVRWHLFIEIIQSTEG